MKEILLAPVLGVGPGGAEEGEAPHEQVGQVGQGVEHQEGGHLPEPGEPGEAGDR